MHGIFTYICLVSMVNVGKNTSGMDGMGLTKNKTTYSSQFLAIVRL